MNYKIILYSLLFISLLFFLIIKNIMMLSLSEIFNPKLSKIEGKVNKFIKKGYNVNITYLYFKGNHKDIQKNIEVFKNIIDYLDIIALGNEDIFKRGKVSIKLIQMGLTYEEKIKNFLNMVSYAKSKNIFVWISAFHYKNIREECSIYLHLLERGFDNIGITIACYHKNATNYVNLILKKGGHIRLVKGYYNDGEIKNWNIVTRIYLENAKNIIKSGNYHQLATHDFKNILDPLNKIKKLDTLHNIEIGFFINSNKHVNREIKKYNINLNNKCMFITFGKKFRYIRSNFKHISYPRLI
jgi:proline dehydrogenase